MNRALVQFESNLMSARQLGLIYGALHDKVTAAISLEEILRAEIALAVSALDCYVHDVVRIGMTKAFVLPSGEPDAYLNFGVSLGFSKRLLRASSQADRNSLLDQEIRRLHGFKTFQSSDGISMALSNLGVKRIWERIGLVLSMTPADLRTTLNVIVDRRNKIVHESDIDPSSGIGLKFPIDQAMVQQAVAFLDSLVKAMHQVIIAEAVV